MLLFSVCHATAFRVVFILFGLGVVELGGTLRVGCSRLKMRTLSFGIRVWGYGFSFRSSHVSSFRGVPRIASKGMTFAVGKETMRVMRSGCDRMVRHPLEEPSYL